MVQFDHDKVQLAATNPNRSKKLRETFNFSSGLIVRVADSV
jgi:hypothetical protein